MIGQQPTDNSQCPKQSSGATSPASNNFYFGLNFNAKKMNMNAERDEYVVPRRHALTSFIKARENKTTIEDAYMYMKVISSIKLIMYEHMFLI